MRAGLPNMVGWSLSWNPAAEGARHAAVLPDGGRSSPSTPAGSPCAYRGHVGDRCHEGRVSEQFRRFLDSLCASGCKFAHDASFLLVLRLGRDLCIESLCGGLVGAFVEVAVDVEDGPY